MENKEKKPAFILTDNEGTKKMLIENGYPLFNTIGNNISVFINIGSELTFSDCKHIVYSNQMNF